MDPFKQLIASVSPLNAEQLLAYNSYWVSKQRRRAYIWGFFEAVEKSILIPQKGYKFQQNGHTHTVWWFSRSKSHIVTSEMHYKNSKGKKKFKRIPSCLWWNKKRFKFRILSLRTSTIFSFCKAFEGGFPLSRYFTAACIVSRFKT